MPKLLMICGPNGAGKSTLSRALALRGHLMLIDPDKLAADGLSPIAAGKAAIRMARLFLKEKVSFVRESTLTAHFDFTLMQEAKNCGYQIELIYIRLASVNLALERIARRVARGGHNVPQKDVLRRFKRSWQNLHAAMQLADKVIILDNSTGGYVKVEDLQPDKNYPI